MKNQYCWAFSSSLFRLRTDVRGVKNFASKVNEKKESKNNERKFLYILITILPLLIFYVCFKDHTVNWRLTAQPCFICMEDKIE